MENYNNSTTVAKRKLNTAVKYSKLSIAFSILCFAYIAIIFLMPPVNFFSVAFVLMKIADKLLLYACPLISLLFAIFGMQEQKNGLRRPALIASLCSVFLVIATKLLVLYAGAEGAWNILKNAVEWAEKY